MNTPAHDVTHLLLDWNKGQQDALEQLMPLVYGELRNIAGRYLRKERQDHTLQTTALVHEAYIRLIDQKQANWQNRAQFFGIAAQMMRRILVDHARGQHAIKSTSRCSAISIASSNEIFAAPLPRFSAC